MSEKTFENAGISDNFFFQEVMKDTDLCKELLELILEVEIDHVTIVDTEKSIKNSYQSKGIRVDAYVNDSKGSVYNIEMQAEDISDILPKRIRFYQSSIDMNLLFKGQKYYQLKDLIIIFICKFDPFDLEYYQYRFKNICVENNKLIFDDGRTIILLNSKGKYPDISPKLKNFLSYVDGNKVIGDSFIDRLEHKLKEVKERDGCNMNWLSYNAALQDAEYIGEKKGEASGKEKMQCLLKRIKSGATNSMLLEEGYAQEDIDKARKLFEEIIS